MKGKSSDNVKGMDFDEIIGRKLEGYGEQPSAGLFARIEKSLEVVGKGSAGESPATNAPIIHHVSEAMPARGGRAARGVWFYMIRAGAVAAVLAVMVVGYSLLFERGGESGNMDYGETVAGLPVDDTGFDDIPVSTDPSSEDTLHGEDMQNNASIIYHHEGMPVGVLPGAPSTVEILYNEPSFSGTLPVVDREITTPQEVMEQGSSNIPSRSPDVDIQRQPIDIYWEELLRQENGDVRPDGRRTRRNDSRIRQESKFRSGRASASLYAENIGTGNYASSNVNDLILSKMTITETSGMDDGSSTVLLPSPASVAPNIPEVPMLSELTHKMPLNFGVTLGIPLSDRLTLISGLNYSLLRSHSSQEMGGYVNELNREVHYLGIPLSVSYSLLDSKRFGLYISGGAMIEKAVYAVNRTTFGFDSGNTEQSKRFRVGGVTPSVNGALGVSLKLSNSMSLYFEPGVSYYFEQVNELPSYRTQYPVSFSLSAGIRFNI